MPSPELNRKLLSMHADAVAAHHHQAVHSLLRPVDADLAAAHAVEIDRRAEAEPLALLVVVEREPVGEALVLDQAVQPRLPVVAEVGVLDREILRAARENRDAVPANRAALDGDVPAPVDANRDAGGPVGIGRGIGALDGRVVEVEGDVVAPDDDQRGVERRRRGEAVRLLRDRRGFRDDHAAPQRDGRDRRRRLRLQRSSRQATATSAASRSLMHGT